MFAIGVSKHKSFYMVSASSNVWVSVWNRRRKALEVTRKKRACL